ASLPGARPMNMLIEPSRCWRDFAKTIRADPTYTAVANLLQRSGIVVARSMQSLPFDAGSGLAFPRLGVSTRPTGERDMIRKSAWLLSAGLTVLATPAFAQTNTPPATTESGKPTTAPPTEGSTSQSAAVQNQAVEQQPVDTSDIVITATRRNEALSDVPMAVSA